MGPQSCTSLSGAGGRACRPWCCPWQAHGCPLPWPDSRDSGVPGPPAAPLACCLLQGASQPARPLSPGHPGSHGAPAFCTCAKWHPASTEGPWAVQHLRVPTRTSVLLPCVAQKRSQAGHHTRAVPPSEAPEGPGASRKGWSPAAPAPWGPQSCCPPGLTWAPPRVPSHKLLRRGQRRLPAHLCPAHGDPAPLPVPARVPAAGGRQALCP